MHNEKVSVLMALYNENIGHAKLAIESVINQTHQNKEFIVIIDNIENTEIEMIVNAYSISHPFIKVLKNELNLGLAKSLNKGISACTGEYIARMDGDDICDLNRLDNQLSFLKKTNSDFVSCNVELIDDNGKRLGETKFKKFSDQEISKIIQFKSPFPHPTWFFKASIIKEVGFYNPYEAAQDYDYLYRIWKSGAIINMDEKKLLQYRQGANSVSNSKLYLQLLSKEFIRNNFSNNTEFSEINYKKFINNQPSLLERAGLNFFIKSKYLLGLQRFLLQLCAFILSRRIRNELILELKGKMT